MLAGTPCRTAHPGGTATEPSQTIDLVSSRDGC